MNAPLPIVNNSGFLIESYLTPLKITTQSELLSWVNPNLCLFAYMSVSVSTGHNKAGTLTGFSPFLK